MGSYKVKNDGLLATQSNIVPSFQRGLVYILLDLSLVYAHYGKVEGQFESIGGNLVNVAKQQTSIYSLIERNSFSFS